MRASEKGWQGSSSTILLVLKHPYPGTTVVVKEETTVFEIKKLLAQQMGVDALKATQFKFRLDVPGQTWLDSSLTAAEANLYNKAQLAAQGLEELMPKSS